MGLDVERCRELFPGLRREVAGKPAVFLDGPAGSQVPRRVIDAMGRYLAENNANCGGPFVTSVATEAMLHDARRAVADFMGVDDADSITFGPCMTALTFSLADSLARTWGPGDEVVVTRLDHDANFTPWIRAADAHGITVRKVDLVREDCTLDMDDLQAKLSPRTRLVAIGAASNAVGSVNPVRRIVDLARGVDAEVFVDAVHLAPHRPIEQESWDADYLTCSAYKFFGPHIGMLWGRRGRMSELPVSNLRPAPDGLPGRWETGTLNHEGVAGTLEAIEYLADLGRTTDDPAMERRAALRTAFRRIREHEDPLCARLLRGIGDLASIKLWGITDPTRLDERVPTLSFTHETLRPAEVAERLGKRGIFVWHGNYYALPVTEALGLEPDGMVRVGLLHYNTADEVDRLCAALGDL
jgi:cysteine desulfurase family protein (TIGR01976 family)